VKVSDEDLDWLRPGVPPAAAAEDLLAAGVQVVLVTCGDRATRVVTAGGAVDVRVTPVPVVDTIGAGDAFTAGFVSWWRATGRGRADLVDVDAILAAVAAAHTVAAAVVTRRGADPPSLADLPPGWPERF
jgi:fructokinase